MKKQTIPVLLICLMLLSCKEELLDPCRMIEIDLTIINQTSEDLVIGSVVFGCEFDINTGNGDVARDFLVKAGETIEESTGAEGADMLTMLLRDSDGVIIVNTIISEEITEQDSKFTILIVFNGSYKLEFL